MANHRAELSRRATALLGLLLAVVVFTSGCAGIFPRDDQEGKSSRDRSGPTAVSKTRGKGQQERAIRSVRVKQNYYLANVRPMPGMQGSPIAKVRGGQKVSLILEKGNWLEIAFQGEDGKQVVGWIYKYLIEGYDKPAPEATPTAPPVNAESTATAEEPVSPIPPVEASSGSDEPTEPENEPSVESESETDPESTPEPATKPISIL